MAADPRVRRLRFCCELADSHGVAVAQERLPEAVERKAGDGRAATAVDSAWGLHDAAAVEPRRDALAGIRRTVQGRTGRDAHGDAIRDVDGAQPRDVVRLLRRRRHLRGVHHGAGAAARRAVRAGVPVRGRDGVQRLHGGVVADVDLVPPRVDDDDQGDDRRVDLRMSHSRRIRLALAGAGLVLGCRPCSSPPQKPIA